MGSICYGELQVRRIYKRFNFDKFFQGLRHFIENDDLIPVYFKPLLHTIAILPYSTAECKRGFSFMTKIITDFRASLLISNVFNLLFIKSN